MTPDRRTQIQKTRSETPWSEEVLRLRKRLGHEPQNPILWRDLGLAYSVQHLFREGVEAISMCLCYIPLNAEALRYRGIFNLHLRRPEEAASDLALSAVLEPFSLETHFHLGLSLFLMGDYARARDALLKCAELAKDDTEILCAALVWLWDVLRTLKDATAANQVLQRMMPETSPESAYGYVCLLHTGVISPERLEAFARETSDAKTRALYAYALFQFYGKQGAKAENALRMALAEQDEAWYAFAVFAAVLNAKKLGIA